MSELNELEGRVCRGVRNWGTELGNRESQGINGTAEHPTKTQECQCGILLLGSRMPKRRMCAMQRMHDAVPQCKPLGKTLGNFGCGKEGVRRIIRQWRATGVGLA